MAGLDLKVLVGETWDLELLTGETLNIMKPSQELLLRLFSLKGNKLLNGQATEKDFEKLLDLTTTLLIDILNFNSNSRKFTKKDVNSMFTFDMIMSILNSYTNFAMGVISNPN